MSLALIHVFGCGVEYLFLFGSGYVVQTNWTELSLHSPSAWASEVLSLLKTMVETAVKQLIFSALGWNGRCLPSKCRVPRCLEKLEICLVGGRVLCLACMHP